MSEPIVLCASDRRGVATVTLNRPEVNNAYDQAMMAALGEACRRLAADPAVRLVLLRGAGRHFQAGADLAHLRQAAAMADAENMAVSRVTAATVAALYRHPKPTIALVQGGCFGGGTGLVAACDVAIASAEVLFSITEVRWGVTPAIILPMLVAKMGLGGVTRYALSAERFGADEALRTGLISAVCPTGALDAAAAPLIEALLLAAPEAVAATKRIAHDLAAGLPGADDPEALAAEAAGRRRLPEAAEGLASFFEKRKPSWYPGDISEA